VAIANFKKVAACSVRYFLPGTIWFPVTTRYAPQLPIRLRTAAESVPGELYKSELKGWACVRAGTRPLAASVLAEKLPGFLVDEMKPGAGEADDGRIRIGIGFVRRGVRKPMLHVRAQPRAFEKDMAAHRREYVKLVRPVTSVCLRSWRGPAGGDASGRPPTGNDAAPRRRAEMKEAAN
jgi:hypothetical protein